MDRLTICFAPWLIFDDEIQDDQKMAEMAGRGFNCVRIEDGAGLLWDEQGRVRERVHVHQPFGKYTKYTTYKDIADGKALNLAGRLLDVCRAARRHGVQVILSSWFYLHTNWFCDEADKRRYLDLSTEEAIAFFGEELDRILSLLRHEGLIDTVAFAEIFNEFDGLPFAGSYRNSLSQEEAEHIRELHEAAIAQLKTHHPDVRIAYDSYTAKMQEHLIPRNIDVLNFHCYYMWPLYRCFEQDYISSRDDHPLIPESSRRYLVEKPLSVADILAEMGGKIETGADWAKRISLYASLADDMEPELTALLEDEFSKAADSYRRSRDEAFSAVLSTHERIVPHSLLVMGEGGSYCASSKITFERDSKTYWAFLDAQADILREKGLWGTVVKTCARPGEISWEACAEKYVRVNQQFRFGKAES